MRFLIFEGGVFMKDKNNKLTAKMKKCAKKLLSDDFDGNISRLCEDVGIARSTFYSWYEREEFKDYIKVLINQYTESELVNVLKAVVESAKKGNLQALKLFFDFKNMYSKNTDAVTGVVFISGEEKIEE